MAGNVGRGLPPLRRGRGRCSRRRRPPSAACRASARPANGDLRDVFLCGDLYLRVDEWGNDDLQRKLGDHGLRVLFEPFGEFFELLALRHIQDGRDATRSRREGRATLRRHALRHRPAAWRRCAPTHPWVFWHDIRAIDRESRRLFDGYPFGESIPTIGSALLTWRTQPVDGVVVVAPRGCGPALIAEAQLRRQAGLPGLFVYNDGDPIDEARLAGFAWRLRSREPRRLRLARLARRRRGRRLHPHVAPLERCERDGDGDQRDAEQHPDVQRPEPRVHRLGAPVEVEQRDLL